MDGLFHTVDEATANLPARFVVELRQGRALFEHCVATEDRRLIGDLSLQFGEGDTRRHGAMRRRRLPAVEQFDGSLAVLSTQAPSVYYHWMMDHLPRFDVLRRSALRYDRLYVSTRLPFQRETLQRLGVNLDSVVEPTEETHLQASLLIAPSLPGRVLWPDERIVRFLRELYAPARSVGSRLLYISRADAQSRQIVNEEELFRNLAPFGFERVQLSGLSVAEQARMFDSARFVCGPHGAGLTNVAFCRPGTRLLEFMPDVFVVHCFAALARAADVRHDQLLCRVASIADGRSSDAYREPSPLNMYVDVPAAVRRIEALLAGR